MYPHKPYPIRRQYAKLKGSLWRCDICTVPPIIVEFDSMIRHLVTEHYIIGSSHTSASKYFTKIDETEKNI